MDVVNRYSLPIGVSELNGHHVPDHVRRVEAYFPHLLLDFQSDSGGTVNHRALHVERDVQFLPQGVHFLLKRIRARLRWGSTVRPVQEHHADQHADYRYCVCKQLLLDHLVKLNREKGVTIVMTSSELKELRSVCDRIAIVTGGKLEGILYPDSSDAEFGLMMSGTKVDTSSEKEEKE